MIRKLAIPLAGLGLIAFANPASAFPHIPKHMRKEVKRVMSAATSAGSVVSGGMSMSCQAVLCLAPYVGQGTDGGPGCEIAKQTYFNIRVFDPWAGYDAGLTQAVRGVFLDMCESPENAGFASAENATVGEAFDAP